MLSGMILSCQPALARYEYDPADLHEGFRCDPDEPAETCAQQREDEAYWEKYGDRYDRWYFALAHNPDFFFGSPFWDERDDPGTADYVPSGEPAGLIDISYSIALRRYDGWTMAISMVCEPTHQASGRSICRPVARMTRTVKIERGDRARQSAYKNIAGELRKRGHPTSIIELADDLDLGMEWLEADLRRCRGAIPLIGKFPGRHATLWPDNLTHLLDGSLTPVARSSDPEREITVTTDGDSIIIRATSAVIEEDRESYQDGPYFQVISQSNGGEFYDWAKELAALVEPCLKPAAAPSPWSAYRDWKNRKAGTGQR